MAGNLRIWVFTCPELISYTVTHFLRYVSKWFLLLQCLFAFSRWEICLKRAVTSAQWQRRDDQYCLALLGNCSSVGSTCFVKQLAPVSPLNRPVQRGNNPAFPDWTTDLRYRLNRFQDYIHVFHSFWCVKLVFKAIPFFYPCKLFAVV